MSGYEMVREKLFIYLTYVVVKLEKMLIKICNLLENRIPMHLFYFVWSKQNVFSCFNFTSGSKIQKQAKISKIAS